MPPALNYKSFLSHAHWLALGVTLLATGAVLSLRPGDAEATRSQPLQTMDLSLPQYEVTPETALAPFAEDLPGDAAPAPVEAVQTQPEGAPLAWDEVTVRRGDNLAAIFSRHGLSGQSLHAVMTSDKETAAQLNRIHPGQIIKLGVDQDNTLQELVYDSSALESLRVVRDGDTYRSTTIERPADRRKSHATGVIHDSLFMAASKAGVSDGLTMQLAGIFGWDIDFALDIRQGDQFTVLYDELYIDGKKLRDGDILAAEFVNRGKVYRAVRYTDKAGNTSYFDPNGRSLRKAFLRTPVDFRRISSHFSTGRLHPVLNRIRAHKGVDYAAPTGTPVKAAGDGKITYRGARGGYGKTVQIQHGSRYSTLYAHLKRYARGLPSGSRVKQGQIIGYVGSSGLATGPHLHYEFRVDGVHRNPLTVKLPEAVPIAPEYRRDFETKIQPLLAQLAALTTVTTAQR